MEKQLSFQLDSRSPGEVINETKRQDFKEPLLKKRVKLKTARKKQNPPEKPAWRIESLVSELLTDPESQVKLKSLSQDGKAGQELFSGISSLKQDAPEVKPPQKKDPLFDNLISVETVAEALGLAPKTIRNWVSARRIPFVRVGRKVMFRQRSFELWLNRKEVKSWL